MIFKHFSYDKNNIYRLSGEYVTICQASSNDFTDDVYDRLVKSKLPRCRRDLFSCGPATYYSSDDYVLYHRMNNRNFIFGKISRILNNFEQQKRQSQKESYWGSVTNGDIYYSTRNDFNIRPARVQGIRDVVDNAHRRYNYNVVFQNAVQDGALQAVNIQQEQAPQQVNPPEPPAAVGNIANDMLINFPD